MTPHALGDGLADASSCQQEPTEHRRHTECSAPPAASPPLAAVAAALPAGSALADDTIGAAPAEPTTYQITLTDVLISSATDTGEDAATGRHII